MIIELTIPFDAVAAKMRAAYDKRVPVGYEDADGFHLGSKPHWHENHHKMPALDFRKIHPGTKAFLFGE
jgi:hypothetical protein